MTSPTSLDTKTAFKQRRLRQILVSLPTVLAIASLLLASDNPSLLQRTGIPPGLLVPGMVGLFVAVAAFSLWNWRCPSCHGYLGKGINPAFCSKCGASLR
jgi:hypothetical protein